jgi:hypothetical protein
MGNQMLQYMLALNIQRLSENLEIFGYNLPLWGLSAAAPADFPKRPLRLGGHFLDAAHIASLVHRKASRDMLLAGLGFKLSNYAPPAFYNAIFRADHLDVRPYGPDCVVMNIRGAEILKNAHRDYGPIPFSYIDAVLENSTARPVFLGQIGDDYYSDALRKRYPDAELRPSQGPLMDFEILRRSSEISMCVSTFSWLAAWLSSAQIIHYPLSGMFNPLQRPDIDLTPKNDPRYRFYHFEPSYWTASADNIASLSARNSHPLLSFPAVNRLHWNAQRQTRFKAARQTLKIEGRARLRNLLQAVG